MLNNPFYDDSETVEEYSEETTEEYTSEEESPVEATETPNNDDEEILGDESEEYEEEDDSPDIEDDEDSEEDSEYEYEDYTVPDYLPDEYVPPDKFNSREEEIEWYKDKYVELIELHNSDDFKEHVYETIKGRLVDELSEIEGNKNAYKAVNSLLNNKPELAIKLYAPQYLAEKGYNNLLTESDIEDIVGDVLSKEFGEDYLDIYNPDSANNPNTLSGRMYNRQKELLKQAEKHNQLAQEYIDKYSPMDETKTQQILANQYLEYFKPSGITPEEFNDFVNNEAREKATKINLADIHKIVYFNDYLESEYERGVRDGKKNLTKDIKRAGNAVQQVPPQPRNRTVKGNDSFMPERYLKGNPFSMNGK